MINSDNFHTIYESMFGHAFYLLLILLVLYYGYVLVKASLNYVKDTPIIGKDVGFYLVVGPLFFSMLYIIAAGLLSVIVAGLQWLALYIAGGILTLYGILYAIRGVVRLNKKLAAHTADKSAHK